MTRTEREQLIERYLGGELTPAEEQEFFIEVATDREMQYDLKASRVVESAIRKDREKAPDSWSGVRGDLVAMLAARKSVPANSEGENVPTRRFPTFRGSSVWVVTAAVLFAVAFTSLLISLIAIDRTSVERNTVPAAAEPPVRVEESRGAGETEVREEEGVSPLPRGTSEEETAGRSAETEGRNRATTSGLRGMRTDTFPAQTEQPKSVEQAGPTVHENTLADTNNTHKQVDLEVETPPKP